MLRSWVSDCMKGVVLETYNVVINKPTRSQDASSEWFAASWVVFMMAAIIAKKPRPMIAITLIFLDSFIWRFHSKTIG